MVEEIVSRGPRNKEQALEALKQLAATSAPSSVGPKAIGSIKDLDSAKTLTAMAGTYLSGFLAERQSLSVSGGVAIVEYQPYTSQLGAGLGLVNETKTLLDLWSPGMSANQLHEAALESGRFPTVTARRLRNIVVECFAPRYLVAGRWACHTSEKA